MYKKVVIKIFAVLLILPSFGGLIRAENKTNFLNVEVFACKDRVSTSVIVSKQAYPDQAYNVVIAGLNGEVDALTGALFASNKKAPILISDTKTLSPQVKAEIERLKAKNVYILGGDGVVSNEVEAELEKLVGFENVKRLPGKDRYETSTSIAKEIALSQSFDEAIVVLGVGSLADALVASPVSANLNKPIFLVESNKIPKVIMDTLKSLKVKNLTIIGGEEAVSENVEESLDQDFIVKRIKGKSRFETASLVAKTYFSEAETVLLANGYAPACALVGGYFGEIKQGPILFTYDSSQKTLPQITERYIKANTKKAYIFGGDGVISYDINNRVEDIISEKFSEEKPIKPEPTKPIKPEPEKIIKVTGVTLDLTTCNLTVDGDTKTLTATVYPANATHKNVKWTSSNKAVVTVDSFGKVTPLAAGTATVTVTTEDGNFTASSEFTVTENIIITNEAVELNTVPEYNYGGIILAGATPINNNLGIYIVPSGYYQGDFVLKANVTASQLGILDVVANVDNFIVLNAQNTVVIANCDITLAEGGKLAIAPFMSQLLFQAGTVKVNGEVITKANVKNYVTGFYSWDILTFTTIETKPLP